MTKIVLYKDEILRIIREGKAVPNWSITDYLDPIIKLYVKLSRKEKKEFHSALLELIQKNAFLDNLLDICREIHLKEVCPILIKLFVNLPKGLKEDGYPIWIEGLRKTIIASLGELECNKAKPFLIRLIDDHIYKNKTKLPKLKRDSYGVVVVALTKISPTDGAKYFGWWLPKERRLRSETVALAKGTDDWKKMEEMGITVPIDERRSHFIEGCILTVAKENKLEGLKRWLKLIILSDETDRNELSYNLKRMLESKDELCD